jgi:hypothetical protein
MTTDDSQESNGGAQSWLSFPSQRLQQVNSAVVCVSSVGDEIKDAATATPTLFASRTARRLDPRAVKGRLGIEDTGPMQ